MVCPQLSDLYARRRLEDEATRRPQTHCIRQGHLSCPWQGWTWCSHAAPDKGHGSQWMPVATCCLCQCKMWCHSAASDKLQNSVKILSKWKTCVIFYQFRKLFRLGCCKLKFNVVRQENVRNDNFFAAVSPTQRRCNERGRIVQKERKTKRWKRA